MNFYQKTNQYYAKWLGVDASQLNQTGVYFVESKERDQKQPGFQHPFKLYVYIKEDLIIVSYSSKLRLEVETLKDQILTTQTIDDLVKLIEFSCGGHVIQSQKFWYEGSLISSPNHSIKKLTIDDYPDYLTLFMTQFPASNPEDWLKEYFYDLCLSQLCFGIFQDGILVSVTDAPDMPYLADEVQEIGVNTLSHYQKRGYATQVVQACIESIISLQKCPIFSCLSSNIASIKIANRVGFKKLADVLTME